jgi:hypothetical protein
MTEELAEIVHFLSANGYLIRTKQEYFIFTNKFYKEFTQHDIGVVPVPGIAIAKSEMTRVVVPQSNICDTPRDAYMRFIAECNIPRRIMTPDGGSYSGNYYSEKGMKAFTKIMMRSDIILALLVHSTQLYYKSSTGYKLKIGNYIGDGAWETDYRELVERLGNGTVVEHIKQELKEGYDGHSRYSTR